MEAITIENMIDLRRVVDRQINSLNKLLATRITPEMRQEAYRQLKSLKRSNDVINQTIKDLQFEESKLPY